MDGEDDTLSERVYPRLALRLSAELLLLASAKYCQNNNQRRGKVMVWLDRGRFQLFETSDENESPTVRDSGRCR
jgi:hypothetical protein